MAVTDPATEVGRRRRPAAGSGHPLCVVEIADDGPGTHQRPARERSLATGRVKAVRRAP
ncbi:hypothetical protein HUT11_06200 [Streptomyces seoulensis]|nr:hypothetical protein HUT11_06200 [Streptomyces seoulensis]